MAARGAQPSPAREYGDGAEPRRRYSFSSSLGARTAARVHLSAPTRTGSGDGRPAAGSDRPSWCCCSRSLWASAFLVVRGLKDGLLADNSNDLPVIVAEQEPAKLRAEEPPAPAPSATSESLALAPAEEAEEAPPSPSETLQRLLGGGRAATEPEPEPVAPAPVEQPAAETRVAIPAAPEDSGAGGGDHDRQPAGGHPAA